jgi:hypothetical protein
VNITVKTTLIVRTIGLASLAASLFAVGAPFIPR